MVTKEQKKEALAEAKAALQKYRVVAVASLQNLPSRQFNLIKKKLRGKAELLVTRTTLFERAIEESRPELKPLVEKFKGSVALITTDLEPFALAKILRQNKSKAPAKPGSIAPFDIIVPAGETNLPPGPVLTELKQAKIDARIQGPKITIVKDSLVAKKGEPIPGNIAAILTKLGIEPMEIGVQLNGVYADGILYDASVLDVDDTQYLANVRSAAQAALNLGVFVEWFTAETTPLLLAKAVREALAIQTQTKPKGAPAAAEGATAPASPESTPTAPPSADSPPAS